MSAPRRAAPAEPARRGWCPSLARPMPTGDGLLARVHPPLGVVSVAQLRAVAQGARRFGNGHVDVTARGNLQIRGVREATAGPLAMMLAAAGLGDRRGDGGPQRLTLTSPLAGDGTLAMARAIEAAGLAISGLPAKTLVAVTGPGVMGEDADLVLALDPGGHVWIALAGDEGGGVEVAGVAAADCVAAMLQGFIATGRRRVWDLTPIEHTDLRHAGEAAARRQSPPPSAGEGGPRRGSGEGKALSGWGGAGPSPACSAGTLPRGGGRVFHAAPTSLAAGLLSVGDRTILVVEPPFGRCTAAILERLGEVALALACPEIRTAPTRGFALVAGNPARAGNGLRDLAEAGFVTRPDDPRRTVAACPGAPACASGSTPVPEHAARLAEAFAPFAARGWSAHVSGCAKGCARPGPADLTLVAEHGLYRLVIAGGPGDVGEGGLTFEAALERVRRADTAQPPARAFRT